MGNTICVTTREEQNERRGAGRNRKQRGKENEKRKYPNVLKPSRPGSSNRPCATWSSSSSFATAAAPPSGSREGGGCSVAGVFPIERANCASGSGLTVREEVVDSSDPGEARLCCCRRPRLVGREEKYDGSNCRSNGLSMMGNRRLVFERCWYWASSSPRRPGL